MAHRLTLTHAFEDAGIERAKAERVASAVYDAIHDEVATKSDLQAVRSELRAELHETEQRLVVRIVELEQRMTRNGIAALVVAVGVIIAAVRFLGHG